MLPKCFPLRSIRIQPEQKETALRIWTCCGTSKETACSRHDSKPNISERKLCASLAGVTAVKMSYPLLDRPFISKPIGFYFRHSRTHSWRANYEGQKTLYFNWSVQLLQLAAKNLVGKLITVKLFCTSSW